MDGIVTVGAIEHAELLIATSILFVIVCLLPLSGSVLIVVAEVWNAFFLVRSPSSVDLILLIGSAVKHRLFPEVFEVHLLAREFYSMVSLSLIDIPQLAHVHLDCLISAHFGHPICEVVEVIFRCKVHVPLFVDTHDLVQVTGLVALSAEFKLTLFTATNYRLDIEEVEAERTLRQILACNLKPLFLLAGLLLSCRVFIVLKEWVRLLFGSDGRWIIEYWLILHNVHGDFFTWYFSVLLLIWRNFKILIIAL